MSGVERAHGLYLPFDVRRRDCGVFGLLLLLERSGRLVARLHEGVVVLDSLGAGVQGLHEDVRSSPGGGRSPNKPGRAAGRIVSSRPSFGLDSPADRKETGFGTHF